MLLFDSAEPKATQRTVRALESRAARLTTGVPRYTGGHTTIQSSSFKTASIVSCKNRGHELVLLHLTQQVTLETLL